MTRTPRALLAAALLAAFLSPAPAGAAAPPAVKPAAKPAAKAPAAPEAPPYKHKRLFGLPEDHLPPGGNCNSCHQVHFGAPRMLLPSPRPVCGKCHAPFSGKFVHKPVAQGNCGGCHQPHTSENKGFLLSEGEALCTSCHPGKAGGAHRKGTLPGPCLGCHDPHASSSRKLTRGNLPPFTCAICHAIVLRGKVSHGALAKLECPACHDPHSTPPKPTLPCAAAQCHGPLIAKRYVHGPAADGCDDCHGVHVAPEGKLLFTPAPAMCLDCHDDKEGGRHGKQAFPGDCRECHDPHGSEAPGLVKPGVATRDCQGCHAKVTEGKEHVHAPAASGECDACHNPHAGKGKDVLPCTECHDDLLAGKVIHAPARGDCGKCHDPHASANRFQLQTPVPGLCLACHRGQKDGKHGKVLLGGECTRCHGAHSTGYRKLLKGAQAQMECAACHSTAVQGKVVHPPVAKGPCGACHDPHAQPPVPPRSCLSEPCHPSLLSGQYLHAPLASPAGSPGGCGKCHLTHAGSNPRLLTRPVPDLCLGCHPAQKDGRHGKTQMNDDCVSCHLVHAADHPRLLRNLGERRCETCHRGKTEGAYRHGAFRESGCPDCHDPHSTPPEMPPLSCLQCHEKVMDQLPGHNTSVKERCAECHDPHVSGNPLLLKPLPDLTNQNCLSCHGDVKRSLERGVSQHQPASQGKCVGCHTSHLGTRPFTIKAFSPDLYTPFVRSAYQLCFDCHDPRKIQVEYTEVDTNFRNGAQNLHYLHVYRDGIKGFSCWSCHDAHAAFQPHLISEETLFNPRYGIKVTFRGDKEGGYCETNCHLGKGYSR